MIFDFFPQSRPCTARRGAAAGARAEARREM